ncbi:MAG: corrinoid protein [Anaerolineales bacterium]|jgi:5-methyltetrahydrofolate--homocysteine methyltransferase|nr:corrinoid protein [Anaerolineales bacterium]
MEQTLEPIYKAVLNGDKDAATENVQAALDTGTDAGVILQEALIPAMGEVGRLFEAGEYYVPEMLIAARAMQAGLAILKPLLVDSDIKPTGRVAIGTVKGDLHDIGKNLVGMMLEGSGFEICDLGTDVSPEKFIGAINDEEVDIIAMSALLTTTMPMMEATIKAVDEAGLRDTVKIIVGGAPVTNEYAEKIGADGFAPDASQAASLAKSLMS